MSALLMQLVDEAREQQTAVTMGVLFDVALARVRFAERNGGQAGEDARHPAVWQQERTEAERRAREALRGIGRPEPAPTAFTNAREALLEIVGSAIAQLEALDRSVLHLPRPTLIERFADAREAGRAPDMAVAGV